MLFFFVDDNVQELTLFGAILARLDIPVQYTAIQGSDELLDKLTSAPALPNIIFLDYSMSPKNGLDCLIAIRSDKRFLHIPVIMYANSAPAERVHQAYINGADYYIQKPLHIEEVKIMLTWLIDNIGDCHSTPLFEDFIISPAKLPQKKAV
jgi:CheY-like chemotaxis protein